MPPPLPPLIDDLTAEILLRLPPDEPKHLFRAALACKPWLRILCDPGFLRRYRAFHGAPPLLGLLRGVQFIKGEPDSFFTPTTSIPNFPHPVLDGRRRRARALDCRHGRVLLCMLERQSPDRYLVWNPATGDCHSLPEPGTDWIPFSSSAVFCAADGCDHLDCRGDGHFRVAFVKCDPTFHSIWAGVYSSETRAWSESELVFLDTGRVYGQPSRAALIGDEIFFTISRSSGIVRYDWSNNSLSVMNPPPPETDNGSVTLMPMDRNCLGLAGIKDSRLYLWSTKVNPEGDAGWVQCRVIELDTILPAAMPRDTSVVGFAEGLDIIFLSRAASLFTIDLKSGWVRKVNKSGVSFSVLPYMSFYTPDHGTLLSLARTP